MQDQEVSVGPGELANQIGYAVAVEIPRENSDRLTRGGEAAPGDGE
jgi:hypothetical protein